MGSHVVRCPRCSEPNAVIESACAACGEALAFPCLRCGTMRGWHQAVCPQCGADLAGMPLAEAASPNGPDTGRTLADRYVLWERLALSRTSSVYAAQDEADPTQRYVIKRLDTVALFRADERREAERRLRAAVERWRAVDHPAVVKVHDLIISERAHYLVMDAVPGLSLRQIIRSPHLGVSPDLARNLGRQICALLAHLHGLQPPIHTPFLAPGHLLVTLSGAVRLVDLGVSHLFAGTDPSYGPYGSVQGYGAPDLETAPPSPISDVYTVGRVLYALLAGVLLEEGARGAPALQRAVPGISRRLVRTIARAAHRDPRERFADATALADALAEGEEGLAVLPMADWLERARHVATLRAPRAVTRATRSPELVQRGRGTSMEEFGFARDERFERMEDELQPTSDVRTAPDAVAPTRAATQGTPRITVQPTELRLPELGPTETKRVALRVRNAGDAPLETRVISRTVGISAPSKPFTLPPGQQARVLLTVSARDLPAEELDIARALEVTSSAGSVAVGLRAQIKTAPLLHLVTPEINFGQQSITNKAQQVLILENHGRRVLTGRIVANAPWLAVQRDSFQCMGGQQVRIPVTLRGEALTRGLTARADAILVDSDGGQARVTAQVYIAEPQLRVGADELALGDIRPDDTLTSVLMLHNTGDAELRGGARSAADWLRVSPERFACEPGETVQLELEVSTAGMAPGPLHLERALQIRSNGGERTLPLRAEIRASRLTLVDAVLNLGEVRAHQRAQGELRLRNDGNAPLMARMDALVPWLALEDGTRARQIVVAPAATETLRFVAEADALQADGEIQVPAGVRIAAEAAVIEVPVRLAVLRPTLSVEPEALDFEYIGRTDAETRGVVIRNGGTGPLGWSAAIDAEWVELDRSAGVIPAGGSETLTLTAYGLALAAEQQTAEATLAITSDAGRAKIPLRVGIAAPLLATDAASIALGPSVNRRPVQGVLRIFNHGLGALKGVIASDKTWLATQRTAFECPTGRSLPVDLYTDMDEFPEDAAGDEAVVTVRSNGGTVAVRVTLSVVFEPDLVAASEAVKLQATEDPPQGRLVLRNQGLATARAELAPSVAQLVLSRHLIDVKPGKSVRIVVEWRGSPPEPGEPPYVKVRSAEQTLRIPVELAD